MVKHILKRVRAVVVACGLAAAGFAAAEPTSQTLLYQGQLSQAGAPYFGLVDLRVRLFDSAAGTTAVSGAAEIPGVLVEGGKFTTTLPFSPSLFNARALWLEIEVRSGGGTYTTLLPRQPVTAAPAARRTFSVANVSSAANAVHADGADTALAAAHATTVQSVTSAQTANTASLADHATVADGVAFPRIGSNPWNLVAGGMRTNDRVGINKTPTESLDVLGTVRLNNQKVQLRSGGSGDHLLGWFGSGSSFANVAPDGPGLIGLQGGMLGTMQGGANIILSWNSAGQVGIGTSNTQGFTFAVNGTAANAGGGLWAQLSDPAAKTDIVPLEGTLDRLLRLRGYEFNYQPRYVKEGLGLPGRQRGLMADEVERVFPDWVDRGDDGLLRVTERSTTALLVESLRELRAEQDREMQQLQDRIRELEAVLEADAGR